MNRKHVHVGWISFISAVIFAGALLFQMDAATVQDFARPVHVTTDWSSRHLIYSGQPKGPKAWAAMQDPRYTRHSSIYGNHERSGKEEGRFNYWRDRLRRRFRHYHQAAEAGLKRDWQFSLGPNAVTGNPNGDFTFPAKFTFDINATPSCTNDFVVFPTGLPGAPGGQASIVALNQLYSGTGAGGDGICGSGQPSVMWAYNTNLAGDTAGIIYSSPVLSLDGSEVAFVETANGAAILKILKWVSGEGTAGAAITPTPIDSGSPWSTCPGTGTSCLFSLPFSGGSGDSESSPFYDYSSDSLYVGDDNGLLHKFTGVFNGTPAEVTTGGWPFTIAPGNYLTGPVFDNVSGNIFVADGTQSTSVVTSLHYVRETTSTVGTCADGTVPCIGTLSIPVSQTTNFGVFDPPTVDQTSQRVFVYSGNDLSNNAVVIQADTGLGNSVSATIQPGAFQMYSGAFDANYNAGNYSSGFLYVCGTLPTTLYRIGFDDLGVMSATPSAGSVNLERPTPSGSSCSPATEILNGTEDFLFFGIFVDGAPTGCASGCVLGLDLSSTVWPPAVSDFSTIPEPNGPSGIVVDNVGAAGQESNIYFGPEGNNCASPVGNGCAVKATQFGLN